jgi:hypothetical protein
VEVVLAEQVAQVAAEEAVLVAPAEPELALAVMAAAVQSFFTTRRYLNDNYNN